MWPDAVGFITCARLQPGYSHRGAEKLFEVRDYRQVLMLADRHDWTAASFGEQLIAAATERLLGLPVPPRAVLVRELLAEHARIASHLSFLGYVPFASTQVQPDTIGAADCETAIRQLRGQARELLAALTGNRVHPMATRLGGIGVDPSSRWIDDLLAWARAASDTAQMVRGLLSQPPWTSLSGVGVLSPEQCDQYGLAGPMARASGVQRVVDARRAAIMTPEPAAGDVPTRFHALIDEVVIAAQDLQRISDDLSRTGGPVETKLSKIVKVPEGEVSLDVDAPMGLAGVHLVSRGATTPWRLRLRTPTFANMQAVQAALVGTTLDQVAPVVASMGYTIGDLDK